MVVLIDIKTTYSLVDMKLEEDSTICISDAEYEIHSSRWKSD